MSTTEAIQEKVPWIPLIVLSVLLGFFGEVWISLIPGMQSFYSLGVVVCSIALSTAPFILLTLTGVLIKVGVLRKMSSSSLVYLYIVGSCASWFLSGTGTPAQSYGGLMGSRLTAPDLATEFIPSFMAPPRNVVQTIMVGGVPVPWGDLMPTILYWWCFFVLIALFFTSVATLFRRDWIDMERMPFQQAMVAHELIRRVPTSGGTVAIKSSLGLRSPFIIGAVLGMIFNLPILLAYLFPWFPDIYSWRTATCGHGAWMGGPSPQWAIVGISMVDKHPLGIAIAYLAPLSILFNLWFWYIVYLVLMQAAFIMGYYTGLDTASTGCCRAWGPVNIRMSPPFKWEAFSTGGMIGLTLFYLLIKRTYLRDTVNAALGKNKEVEKTEPVTYKAMYIMLVVSFVLITALMAVSGLSLAPALLFPITIFLFWMCNSRLWGMTGTYIRTAEHGQTLYRLFIWPTAPDPRTREFVLSAYMSEFNMDCPENQNGGSLFSAFASYKLASLTGTSNRNVFMALLVVQIIIPLASMLGWFWVNYTLGYNRLAQIGSLTGSPATDRCGYADNWNRLPGTDPWVHIFAAGILSVGVMTFLHARFVWFPFEPIGFLLAFSDASLFFGMWMPALIAWVLKTLTLRIGGAKLYENIGVPLVAGFVIGFIVVVFMGGIMGMVRFFVPF